MAREYLRITTESSWGTYNGAGTTAIVQLTDSNAFTMRPVPVRWTIRSAGGYNRRVQTGSSKTMLSGALNNLVLFHDQTSFWTNWIQPNTSSPPDMPSCTIDHAVVEDIGGSTIYRRYLGVKVGGWNVTSNSDSQLLRLSLTDLVGQKPATITGSDFSEPAIGSYPSSTPFVHEHASTATLGGTSRVVTGFDTFQVTGRNLLDPRFFNSTTIAYLKYCGRDIDWSIQFPYTLSGDTDRLTLFETTPAGTSFDIIYTNGSGGTLNFQFQGQNVLQSVQDVLDYNRLFLHTISGFSQVDASVTNDRERDFYATVS